MKRAGSKAKPGTLTPARVSAFSQGPQQQEGGPVPRPSDALVASSSTPRIGKRRFGAAGSATAAPRGDRCQYHPAFPARISITLSFAFRKALAFT